ncbi:hypothetical protein ANO11243_050560 [Dothideomycetidae sp. 11243]|nr:hypothetical protein ANO11243_050560 [fungal sp. No.11243]
MALDAQRNWDVSMADDLHRVKTQSRSERLQRKADLASTTQRLEQIDISNPRKPAVHLPAEVLIQIIDFVASSEEVLRPGPWRDEVQNDLHACSLVSQDWNAAATPALYARPRLHGPIYDLFTRTICPSINIAVRKSPLSSFVKDLDLTMLVHQGSKSITARLLGRTKYSLERFAAPQASFSLNCFPALGKCSLLTYLDLSLVSEATSLSTLFDTVADLPRLKELHLPRSAGFGVTVDPADIHWPPALETLGLSGGLDSSFWLGRFQFPKSLTGISVTHCPKLDGDCMNGFLATLASAASPRLKSLTFAHLLHLDHQSLDSVLYLIPHLSSLSVSLDYVTPEVLNPFRAQWHSIPKGTRYTGDVSGPTLALSHLHLSNSGDIPHPNAFLPLDVLITASDYRTVPNLTCVMVDTSLSYWFSDSEEENLEALDDWLVANAKKRGSFAKKDVGVKRIIRAPTR